MRLWIAPRRRIESAGGTVFIASELVWRIDQEARRCAPHETGGMLVGYRTSDTPDADVVVCELVDAGPGAKRARGRFEPDGAWQQQQLAAAYASSGRVHTYLGDWHSHPRGGTRPSKTDRDTYRRVAAHPQSRTTHPLMLIVSFDARRTRHDAFVLDGGDPLALRVIEASA